VAGTACVCSARAITLTPPKPCVNAATSA